MLLKECSYPEVDAQLGVLDTLAGLGLALKPATLRSETGLGVLKRVVKVNCTNYTKVKELTRLGEMLSLSRGTVMVTLLEEALHHSNLSLCKTLSADIVSNGTVTAPSSKLSLESALLLYKNSR